MTRSEKMLFHQIHPIKLLVDIGSSFASTWLLWQGSYSYALAVAFLPSMIASAALVQLADLDRLRHSWFGNYVASHMHGRVVAQRIVGQLVVWLGAVIHVPWLVPFGYTVIVFAWLDGLWRRA